MTEPSRQFGSLRTAWRHFWRSLLGTPSIRQELADFLGSGYDRLQTHDKTFPGYDLASVHAALASLRADCTTESREIGACNATTLRQLFDWLQQIFHRNLKPSPPTYERVPVDVDREESYPTNALILATLKPEGPGKSERIAVLLAVNGFGHEYWDGMDTQQVPRRQICVSIACHSKDVADRFFTELEARRQRLSIYRGKVIDPVVGPGAVHTIGFRAIHKVRADDLILPASVKILLDSAILGFYRHRDLLTSLGIELKRGILFHGPPGTGKTSLSLYLAGHLPHFTVCFVSGERLLYPREICRMARYLQPAMVVFEDIDLVAEQRNATGLATVLGELMNQIDGCEPNDQVLFVMNTNSIDRLEHAVKNRPGRVDQIIEVPLPGPEERQRLLEHFARNLRLEVHDLPRVLQATEGTTPAMLKEIVKRAAVARIERNGDLGPVETIAVGDDDLLLATAQVRALRDREAVSGSLGFR